MIPTISRVRISWAVPVAEIAVAVGLAGIFTRPYATAAGILLLLGYAAAIAVNLRRGRRDLACGCGGPDERRPISAWMVWRNILIALLLAGAFAPWTERALTLTDGITIVFGVLTIALIYLCADQLLGNAQLQRTAQRFPMSPLTLSVIVLWIVVLGLLAVVLELTRQLGCCTSASRRWGR